MMVSISTGWHRMKLADVVCSITGGLSLTAAERSSNNGEHGILTLSAISYGSFDPAANKAILEGDERSLGPNVRARTVLISRSNTLELVGACVYVDRDYPQLHLPDLIWELSTDESRYDPEWLYYALTSPSSRTQIQNRATGTSGSMKKLSMASLRGMEMVVPPLPEQKAIAAVLSAWDRGIRHLTDLIAAKVRFKQGLMQQLLSGKRRFTEFVSQEWSRVHLNDLLREEERYVDWDEDAEYRLVSIRRRSGGMFFREAKYGRDIKTQVMKTTRSGDFIIARMQAVHGAMTVTPPEFDGYHVSDSYTTFVSRDPSRLWMPFLNYLSQTAMFYRLALLSAYGVTIEKMTFNLDWFLAETVLLPQSLDEQMKIASVLGTADKEINLIQNQLNALKQQKKGLMQKLLTGEVRVKL